MFGSGIGVIYPPEHAHQANEIIQNVAISSEHPWGVQPYCRCFPYRNRLLSDLNLGTLVVAAGEGKAPSWTVSSAVVHGREASCMPESMYSSDSKLTNRLIQEGTKLLVQGEDLLERLRLNTHTGERPEPRALSTDTGEDAQVPRLLKLEPQQVEGLSPRTVLFVTMVTGVFADGEVERAGGAHALRARTGGVRPSFHVRLGYVGFRFLNRALNGY